MIKSHIRALGNILLLMGQALILYHSMSLGIIIKLIGCTIVTSEFIISKDYDVVITMVSFGILDLSRLLAEFF